MRSHSGNIVGYADQPIGTPRGDADGQRLRASGVRLIHHECDLERRSTWHEMVSALSHGDHVVVVALDRLSRPMRTLLRNVAELRGRGVRLRSLEDGVDLDDTDEGDAQTRLALALVECLNAWGAEDARRRGRTMDERGARPGAHPKLKGVSKEELLALLGRPGASQASVARDLGVGRTTLYRSLKRLGDSGSR